MKKKRKFNREFALKQICNPKRKLIFQPSFFQGRTVKFRGCKLGDDGKKLTAVCFIRLEESCTRELL